MALQALELQILKLKLNEWDPVQLIVGKFPFHSPQEGDQSSATELSSSRTLQQNDYQLLSWNHRQNSTYTVFQTVFEPKVLGSSNIS